MPVWVGHVRGPAAILLEDLLLDVEPVSTQALDRRVVALVGQVHGVVDVDAAATAREADLRSPETDARPLARHDPDGVAMVPPLDERQPEHLRVEANRLLEVDDLEHELVHARDWNSIRHAIRSRGAYSSMRQRSTPSSAN